MALIVVDNYEDLLNFNKLIRVIIIDNNNSEKTKISIENIKKISNIPITVFTHETTDYNNYQDIETVAINPNNNILSKINELLLEKSEDFFCILYSGDILLDSFNETFSRIMQKDIDLIGAIVFDDFSINNNEYNFKPNFSPDLYLENDYIHNSVFINRTVFNSIGGFDTALSNNFIRDIIFRMYLENFENIKEDIVCFKLNENFNNNLNENKLFLEKQLSSQNIEFEVISSDNTFKPIYKTQNKKASIIIPFKDQSDVTKTCVDSILKKTDYENYEIILINNNSSDEKTIEFMEEITKNPRVKLYNYQNPFNWSKINNFGATKSNGDVLIFLNNDTEVISKNWLSLLIGDAIQDKVGVVGAKLFYPDKTIQHAGVVIGLDSLASHLFAGNSEKNIPELYKLYRRNVSSVTGACLAIEKKLFNKVNGFNERFEVSFSDIEICLRLLEQGYNNIFNPNAMLYHHEMKTRSKKEFREIDRLLGYSAFSFYFENGDPFFNSNFSLNNSKKLTLKKDDEIPGFENYWRNWSRNRNNRINKIHTIIEKNKNNSPIFCEDFSNDDLISNGILMDAFFKNPKLKLNNILWFIPSLKNITEDVIYNLFLLPNFLSKTEESKNFFKLADNKNESELVQNIKTKFPNMTFKIITNIENIPKMDATFCFDQKTAYDSLKFNNCVAKYYIINENYQNYNNQTHHFDFIGISNSQNIVSNYIKENTIMEYFNPIINNEHYFYDTNVNKINRSVLLHVDGLTENEFLFSIEIIKIIKEYFGNGIKIFIEGREFDSKEYNLNDMAVNLGVIGSSEKLSQYYKQSQVVLTLHSTKNIIYKILNSMACGCVNITPVNTNLPIFLRDSENIIFTPHSMTTIAEEVIRLLHDVNLRDKIVNMGLTTINQLNTKNELEQIVTFIKNPNITMTNDLSNSNEDFTPSSDLTKSEKNSNNDKLENTIKELRFENNKYRNREWELKLINKRETDEIIKLNQELSKLKNNKKNKYKNFIFNKK